MLDTFAMKMAKEHPDEKVTFAIFLPYTRSTRPLLQLDLEVKYESFNLENVSVVCFENLSELKDANLTNHYVCIDEISFSSNMRPEDFLEILLEINPKSVWIAIRDTGRFDSVDPEQYLREKFTGWEIVNLVHPLRTTKNVSEKVKSAKVVDAVHSNEFNSTLVIAPNMPLGPDPLILPRSEGSIQARLQHVFSEVVTDQRALIILDIINMEATQEEIHEAKRVTSHQELAERTDHHSQRCMVGIEAVKACQRPQGPPLLWFDSDSDFVSDTLCDTEDSVKEWMKGKKNISGRDLISDTRCVLGYEADFVIYVGAGRSNQATAFMSRCRGQFVHISEPMDHAFTTGHVRGAEGPTVPWDQDGNPL